jgi:hypothetical protein
MLPSVQDTASCFPVLSKETCLTARGWSRSLRFCLVSWTFMTLTTSSLGLLGLAWRVCFVTYSLATAIQFPSGLRATSRMGKVARSSISSNFPPSMVYLLTVPSSDPVMKKPFYMQSAWFLFPKSFTYTRYDCRVVLLAVVDCVRFIV